MIASFRAENLKTRKRWANWIILGILLAWILILVYLVPYIFLSNPPKNFNSPVPASELKRTVFPENLVPNALSTAGSIASSRSRAARPCCWGSSSRWLRRRS